MNILVIPAGTETASEIYKSLKNERDFSLFGIDSNKLCALFLTLPKQNQAICSDGFNTEKFWAFLEQKIDEWNIDLVFPTHDDLVVPFAIRKKVDRAQLICQSLFAASASTNKLNLYDALKDKSFVPKVYDTIEDYPVFIKPAEGRGSIDAHIVKTPEEFFFYSSRISKPIVTEYLPGKEYTIDCLSSLDDHRLINCSIRERIKIQRGISSIAATVFSKEICAIAKEISMALKMQGPWFFQIKENMEGIPKLLEVNARIPGAMSLSRYAGFNLPLATCYLYRDGDVKTEWPMSEITVSRNLQEHYIDSRLKDIKCAFFDFDDTIILWNKGGAVNIEAITLIAKLHSMDIPCFIITRNTDTCEVRKRLKPYAGMLYDCFIGVDNKVKVVRNILQQYRFSENQVLFIDDSWHERSEVLNTLSKIKVFSPSAIGDIVKSIGYFNEMGS